jgi:hypothetical protein
MSDSINLIYPAIITNILTLFLFIHSKSHDKILLSLMIIGQLILLSGESDKNLDKIQLSHILFTTTLIFGSLYFNQTHNQIFVLILLLITIISRYILSECLFNMSNSHHEFEFESVFDFINYDYLFYVSIIIVSYRLFKDKIINNV